MIYLDNGATTFPKPACVWDAVDRCNRTAAVNAGRGAYRAAREATAMVKDVKRALIDLIDARGQAEVVLAPSSTIALNQILFGFPWEPGMNAYVSPYEHNAVLRPLELIRERFGVNVLELPLGEDLSLDLPAAEALFREAPPALVCCTAVSNVTGYILPAPELFRLARQHGAFTVLDASQALGLTRMRFSALQADCVAFAGHKTLYAPFGIAGFYIRNGVDLREVIAGGNGIRSEDPRMPRYMPEKLEAGSMDVPAIAGLAASLEWLKGQDLLAHERELMDYLIPALEEIPGVTVYKAPDPQRQTGIVSFNLEGFRANEVAALLDLQSDIAVRAGHHCAGRIHRHLKDKPYDGTVRVSVGAFTTLEELRALTDAVRGIDRELLKGIDSDILRGNC